MLQANDLTLMYKDGNMMVNAVSKISLTIKENQFVGILGPSGSGKSSLLYLLSGLRHASKGEIYLDGRPYGKMKPNDIVSLRRKEFGFVFQQHFLINYLTVLENVMVSAPEQNNTYIEQAKTLLSNLGMQDKLNRYIHELSGGERQRVAIGRAMIHNPRFIFADEPTGLLDSQTGLQVISFLRNYRKHGSLVAVTHNPDILNEADMIIKLCDGKIVNVENRNTCVKKESAL